MIALAVGLGVLGFFALRRARRRCYAGGFDGYGWHGPWANVDDNHEGYHRYGGRHRRRGRRWMLHRALARIDATPAQERVIVGEIDRLTERVRAARGGLGDVRTDLAAAVRGSAMDDAALGAVLGRVDGVTADVRAAAVEALRTIHGVLDEKQRVQLAEMLEQGRRGGGYGGGWRMSPYR